MQESLLVDKGNQLHRIILNIVTVFAFLYGIINIFLDNLFDCYVVLVLFIVSLFCHYFFRKGLVLLSKALNLTSVITAISFLTLYDGYESFTVVFFLPTLIGSLIIFQGKDRKLGIALASISFLVYLILVFGNFSIGSRALTAYQIQVERILNLIGAIVISVLETYYILNLSNRIQSDLLDMNNDLNEANSQLNKAINLRDKITSTISHDVRGPVAMMSAGLNVLNVNQSMSKDEVMVMAELRKSAEATVDMIDNLLMWSVSQTKQIGFKPEMIMLSELRRMFSDLKSLYQLKDIEVVHHMAENEMVFADRVLLQSILRNLFSNAVKFTPAGGKITIGAQPVKNGIMISIKDSGLGITQDAQDRILSGDMESTIGINKEIGHGIGLQLVRDFLSMHKAELLIESELGKGSVFYFTLPKA